MKLEDIFVKQRPPKDYVTYPPQEVPTLEKFLAERTNPPSPEVGPIEKKISEPRMAPLQIPKEEAPIAEPELQEMKTAYAAPIQDVPTQPTQQTQQPSYSAPRMPAMDKASGYDLSAITELADKISPKSNMYDILPALVPAALDLLSGGYGQGFKVAGDYLVGDVAKKEARKQKLEDMLLALEKSKLSKRSSKGFQLKPLRSKATGESVMGTYDPNSGTMYGPQGELISTEDYELAPGLSTGEFERRKAIGTQYGQYVSPETGLRTVMQKGVATPIREQAAGLGPKQQKDLTTITSKFISSDAYKKPANSMQAAAAIDELIQKAQSGNPSAAQFARKELAKIAEGGGRLSDQDFQMAGGSPSLRATAQRYANLQQTDQPLTQKELKDLKEIADVLYTASENKLRSAVSNMSKGAQIDFGVPEQSVLRSMESYIPAKPKSKTPLSFEEWKKKYGTKK